MSNTGTRTLDNITRIYKNANGDVIGVHCIEVIQETAATPTPGIQDVGTMTDRSKRWLKTNKSFLNVCLTMGASREIATVQMLGGYNEIVMNGSNNDVHSVIYYGQNTTNDSYVAFNLYPTVGDTV